MRRVDEGEELMKNFLCIGLLSLVVLSGTTLAQKSQDGSGMSGTTEHTMKEEEKGRGGNSMESVLRKIMEQCGGASKSRREKERKEAAVGATEKCPGYSKETLRERRNQQRRICKNETGHRVVPHALLRERGVSLMP